MMTRFVAAAVLCFVSSSAFSQTTHGTGHGAMGHSDATAGYMTAMDNMNTGMNAAMTGDPDIDFVLMMIPHHEGAVEMAKIALEHATDPQVRALAEAVVTAQTDELDMMRAWLAEKGL